MTDTAVLEKRTEQAYAGYPKWYRELNNKARIKEAEMQWPDARQEAWRRSEIKRIDLENLFVQPPEMPEETGQGPGQFQIPHARQKNLRLAPLAEAIQGDFPGVRQLLEQHWNLVENRFQARLLAEPPRGFYLYLPLDYQASDLIFLEDRINSAENSFTLNLVVLEQGARAQLWERISQEMPQGVLHNRSTLFLLKDQTQLEYQRTQSLEEQSQLLDFSRAMIYRGAQFHGLQVEGGINFNKSHLHLQLLGAHSRGELKGIYMLKNHQFTELFTHQEHVAEKAVSHSLYRGVLEGQGRSVYNGMIKVAPKAVNTDAYLTNNNLLLGDGCRADSIPGLNIETNEVRCSHGSTTGKMNVDQLFYLTARGLSVEEAKTLMTQAFLDEVIHLAHPLVKVEIQKNWGLAQEETTLEESA